MISYRQNYVALRHVPPPQAAAVQMICDDATPSRRRKTRARRRVDSPILTTKPAFDLLDKIEDVTFSHGLTESQVGELAAGDRSLISGIRDGRRLRPQTRARLVDFLDRAERGELVANSDRLLPPAPRPKGEASAATDLIPRIERAIVERGITATKFGRRAVNDPGLLPRLRAGGGIREATREKIVAYLSKLEWRP